MRERNEKILLLRLDDTSPFYRDNHRFINCSFFRVHLIMKIIGITRVRNESHIIGDTLEHVSKLVDGIIVMDDCSTDNTFNICHNCNSVIRIYKNKNIWETDPNKRTILEGKHRQMLYNWALEFNPDWIYYFDADEFADFEGIDFTADAYKLRLWDYYITPEDKNLTWKDRKWIGPEYRDITMLFRPHPSIRFSSRVPKLPASYVIKKQGSVKHYSKAISVENWEETCQYYINHLNEPEKGFKQKWQNRIGKAIHTKSDFGRDLITWEDRNSKGIKL